MTARVKGRTGECIARSGSWQALLSSTLVALEVRSAVGAQDLMAFVGQRDLNQMKRQPEG